MSRWKVEQAGWYDGPIYDILDANTGEDICSVYLDEKLANFIATAPELLEQLEIVLAELLIAWDKNADCVSSEAIDREIGIHKAALLVIAKAKGVLNNA